jgi:protein-L-isoaspartate O-methyltransferase
VEEVPFDAIIVTAPPRTLPPTLTGQSTFGGCFRIPLNRQHKMQLLTHVLRHEDGGLLEDQGLPVAVFLLFKTI